MKQNTCPPSATRGWIVFAGLLTFLGSLVYVREAQMQDVVEAAALCLGLTALSQALLDLFVLQVHKRESTGLDWQKKNASVQRTSVKLFGLLGSLGFIGFLYWVFPEYHGDFYNSYWQLLKIILPWWLALAVPYFYILDGKQKNPEDGYFQVGLLVLLHFEKVQWNLIRPHVLGWLVKGFFLPLMFTYLTKDLTSFLHYDFSSMVSFKSFFDFTYEFIFLIDVGLVAMGYLMSLRLTDSHLRSTEPTMLGWVVALICYQPFWSLFGKQYIEYSSNVGWGSWLADSPRLYMVWGTGILILFFIYVWSSVMFGIRFSNLTHRGILTNGPYRWTKHPAYVAKNLGWWLTSVPFFALDGFGSILQKCCLLLMINMIYYFRARTEELHLSQDPEYVRYSEWIDENGIFRWLPSPRKGTRA